MTKDDEELEELAMEYAEELEAWSKLMLSPIGRARFEAFKEGYRAAIKDFNSEDTK